MYKCETNDESEVIIREVKRYFWFRRALELQNAWNSIIKMAVHCEGGGKDEVKTQFGTREGTYKVMTFSEYRPNRSGCSIAQINHPVKVSFITLPDSSGNGERICFNVGRELYFYMYKGLRKVSVSCKAVVVLAASFYGVAYRDPNVEYRVVASDTQSGDGFLGASIKFSKCAEYGSADANFIQEARALELLQAAAHDSQAEVLLFLK